LSATYLSLRQGSGILDRFSESSDGPGLVVLMNRTNIPRLLQIEVALIIILLVGALCTGLIKKNYAQVWIYGGLLSLTMLPASTDEMFGLGERMVLVVAMAAMPIAMMAGVGARKRDEGNTSTLKTGAITIGTLCATALWAPSAFSSALSTANYTQLKVIVDAAETRKPEILIAKRALSFYYTALTGRDAFMFDPDPDWDRSKVWRVAFDVDIKEILYFVPAYCYEQPVLTESLPRTDAILIREDCWEAFRKGVSKDELPGLWGRIWDDEENPSRMRPKFLKSRYLAKPN